MSRVVVDTNVPIVANGRPDAKNSALPSIACREAAVKRLQQILVSERVLLDLAGEIQAEYRTRLNASGQPGVGDRFYQAILNSAPSRIVRVELPKLEDGEFEDLPRVLIETNFDPSDRKFAALAKREQAPVINATDSDWLNQRETLEENGIRVEFVCGCDSSFWFTK
jgi:predicted nucleic acid-binding protein